MKQYALTTYDNPFNPFDNFQEWFSFDTEMGYNSCSLLMRIANVTDDMSDTEETLEIERAIDQIIKYDFLGIYEKVAKELNIPDDDDQDVTT